MESGRFTIETGSQPAGIAVIRVEGPGTPEFLRARCGLAPQAAGEVAALRLRTLTSAAGLPIDQVVIACFAEFEAELSLHGGPEIVRQVAAQLSADGFRRKPSWSGAPEDAFARTAWSELPIRDRIAAALPWCRTELAVRTLLAQEANQHLEVSSGDNALRRLLRPPTVAVIGPANVGKSTLVNALARSSVAIVADLPGTTRDYVLAEADLDGLIVRLVDTPGSRTPGSDIEAAAMANADSIIRRADLRLQVYDATRGDPGPITPTADPATTLLVGNRCDLASRASGELLVSALTGDGVSHLRTAIRSFFGAGEHCVRRRYEGWD